MMSVISYAYELPRIIMKLFYKEDFILCGNIVHSDYLNWAITDIT